MGGRNMARCMQCKATLNPVAAVLSDVCGTCCKANHAAAVRGVLTPRRKKVVK